MQEEGFFSCLYVVETFICCECREAAMRDNVEQGIAENTFNKENHC